MYKSNSHILYSLTNLIFYTFCIISLITLFLYPTEIFFASKTGLLLWYNNILPTIFPFIVIINIICYSNFEFYISNTINKILNALHIKKSNPSLFFSFIMGCISGYPLGASIVASLLKKKSINSDEANKAICYCNNCGPLFILSSVGINMLKSKKLGLILLASQFFTSLLLALFFKLYKNSSIQVKQNTTYTKSDIEISKLINTSIINAVSTILNICGTIISFCIIIKILEIYKIENIIFNILTFLSPFKLNYDIIKNLFYGVLEITNGIYLISISNCNEIIRLLLTSFLINFGGLCVHMQTYDVISDTKINFKSYMLIKLISGLISIFFTFILYSLL